jgi:hypothetical protein
MVTSTETVATTSEIEYRGYVRRSAASNFVFNFFINAGLAWWLLRESSELTAWGSDAYGPDLLITGFLLSTLVAAIVMEIHKRKAANGGMGAVPLNSKLLQSAAAQNRFFTCLAIGVLGTVASAVAVLCVAAATTSLSVTAYAGLKGLWAGFLAAAIVYPATALGLHLGTVRSEAA